MEVIRISVATSCLSSSPGHTSMDEEEDERVRDQEKENGMEIDRKIDKCIQDL